MALVHLLVQLRDGQRLLAVADLRVAVRVLAGGLADVGQADRDVVALDVASLGVARLSLDVTRLGGHGVVAVCRMRRR